MSISKKNCLYQHAELVGSVQDATLKNHHKVSASHVSKSRKEDLGLDKFSSNMKYLLKVYPFYEKTTVKNLTQKAIQLKVKTEKISQKDVLKIPNLLAQALISYRMLHQVGKTPTEMASLLEEEDFHPFLAHDISEYMKREKPPKKAKKRGRKKKNSTEIEKTTDQKEAERKSRPTRRNARKGRPRNVTNQVKEQKVQKQENNQQSPSPNNDVIRLYEVTLRDESIKYVSGASILAALGTDSIQGWDVLQVKEFGILHV